MAGPEGIKLLPVAVLYGPNASGKSNVLRALESLWLLLGLSQQEAVYSLRKAYQPFRFAAYTAAAPCQFELIFLMEGVRYAYSVAFEETQVVHEKLVFYPKGREARLFERQAQDFQFGEYLKGQKAVIAELTRADQLYLVKASENNLTQLRKLVLHLLFHFTALLDAQDAVYDVHTPYPVETLQQLQEDPEIWEQALTLLKGFDTGIKDIKIEQAAGMGWQVSAVHEVFDASGKKIGEEMLPFYEESAGTQQLFRFLGSMLRALQTGKTLLIDEFERSLHPHITTYLISLFQNPKLNRRGAQLLLATHDTHLLHAANLSREQIWLVEKDSQGGSELFSLADVGGVRTDLPFEKWYLSGRFGAVPKLQTLDFELNIAHSA